MRQGRLPDGFGVRIDPRVRAYRDGQVLVGGSPTRLVTLAPAAAAMIGDGYLQVSDQKTAGVARRLLDSGVGNPRPMLLPSTDAVTVVVPIRNNVAGLERLLAALRGHAVIVVDDGSDRPVRLPTASSARCPVTVIRHEVSRGPAAARNTGMRAATTEFVAFLDSDVVPRSGWLEVMLGHFSDPSVALVAPRIVALDTESNALAKYEHVRSALDQGRREAPVKAASRVSYVPSAAMLVRRSAVRDEGGFDETMQVGEDVDLCWRLEQAGWRLRYEPAAKVAHDHRVSFGDWIRRKEFYGESAAPLAARHDDKVAPLRMTKWSLLAIALLATMSRIGFIGALASLAIGLIRIRRTLSALDRPNRVAVVFAARGFAAGLWQVASVLCRHYWPITALAMLFSARIRNIAFAVAVAEGIADWATHRDSDSLDPVRYIALKRLDDLAYGAGLWRGALRARSLAALRPTIVS